MAGIDTNNIEQLAGAVYFAVGRGTEGGGSSYHLSITGVTNPNRATDPGWGNHSAVIAASGYSLGAIQVDFGQRGNWPLGAIEGRKLHEGEQSYVQAVTNEAARYAKENDLPFTQDLRKLEKDLLTNGSDIHFIDTNTRDSINAWASSKEGMQWIHQNIDRPQVMNATQAAVDMLNQNGKGIAEKDRFEAVAIIAKTANQSPAKLGQIETTLAHGGDINALHHTVQDIKHNLRWFAADAAGKFAERYEANAQNPDVASALSRAHAKVMSSSYDPSTEKTDTDIQTALKATFGHVKTETLPKAHAVEQLAPQSLNTPLEIESHPELSKTAQTLITDATTHTKQWASDNNREWNEQFNQAAHSVAHAAHKEGLTGINLFLVKDGEIHFAQRNHWGTNVASVDAKIASNTDVNSNLQAMADIDQTRAHSHRQAQEQSLTQSRGRSI